MTLNIQSDVRIYVSVGPNFVGWSAGGPSGQWLARVLRALTGNEIKEHGPIYKAYKVDRATWYRVLPRLQDLARLSGREIVEW